MTPDNYRSHSAGQSACSKVLCTVRTCGQFIEKVRSSKLDITARTIDKSRRLPLLVAKRTSHLW